MLKAICLLVLSFLPAVGFAAKLPEPSPADPRIKTVVYNARDVVELRGHYGYTMTIQFAEGEVYRDGGVGDSVAWQVVPTSDGNALQIKPVEDNAATNLNVTTNRRHYAFNLTASSDTGRDLTYRVNFVYPEDELARKVEAQRAADQIIAPALPTVDAMNFRYSASGDMKLRPLRVMDNGKFTYVEFEPGKRLPAFFAVDGDGKEALVNFHVQGRYVVIERTSALWTFVDGKSKLKIRNDTAAPSAPKTRRGRFVQL